jgi:hypothetical protein
MLISRIIFRPWRRRRRRGKRDKKMREDRV